MTITSLLEKKELSVSLAGMQIYLVHWYTRIFPADKKNNFRVIELAY